MKLLETIRRKSFWALDILKGSKVKNDYKDIKLILENHTNKKAEQKNDDYLIKLLDHAVSTTPFYINSNGKFFFV